MKIRQVDLASLSSAERGALVARSPVPDPAVRDAAVEIVQRVRNGGDGALLEYSQRFGGTRPHRDLAVSPNELREALDSLEPSDLLALQRAIANIRRFHAPQRPVDRTIDVAPGVAVQRRWTPLRRVGVYVPGGAAAYPSSLLMGVIPAQIAGVGAICVVSPAAPDGTVSRALLAAAALLGVDEVYIAGGAQAVAALAYGTESIPRVDKIVGPGNAWVTAAKLAVFGDCAIDLPAGPSEALILTDGTADPRLIAADLLCQAEHGPDSPVVLVTTEPSLVGPVLQHLSASLQRLDRAEVLRAALSTHGLIITAPDHSAAIEFADQWAPEHLSIHTVDAAGDAERITHAGSVFVGPWSPESAGDYATGANHVLPTGGLARSHGPLSVEDFGSWRQVQHLTRAGLEGLRPTIVALADLEGLSAHKHCVEVRFDQDRDSPRGALT